MRTITFRVPSLLILLTLFSFLLPPAPAFADNSQGFHDALHNAFLAGMEGRKGTAIKAFENLLKASPQEWVIYDFYTQTLEGYDDFQRADSVYAQALPLFPERTAEIETRRKVLAKKEAFLAEMKNAPPWEQAKAFGSNHVTVQSNLPESYYLPVVERIHSLMDQEKALFKKILGAPVGEEGYLKILLFGRSEEYFKYKGKNFEGYSALAYYMPAKDEMVIFFNGEADWNKIAHELSHYLLRHLYYQNPSAFMDEGLAEYMAYKLEKESGKRHMLDVLEFINWFYDQGMLEKQEDFFRNWQVYERATGAQGFSANNLFYTLSWSLVAFFVESEDPKVKDFFNEFTLFERRNAKNNLESVRWFFLEHSAPDLKTYIQDKWLNFLLTRTYENI